MPTIPANTSLLPNWAQLSGKACIQRRAFMGLLQLWLPGLAGWSLSHYREPDEQFIISSVGLRENTIEEQITHKECDPVRLVSIIDDINAQLPRNVVWSALLTSQLVFLEPKNKLSSKESMNSAMSSNMTASALKSYFRLELERSYKAAQQTVLTSLLTHIQSESLDDKEDKSQNEQLSRASSYMVMKVLATCGIPARVAFDLFYDLHEDYWITEENFFCDIERLVELKMCTALDNLPLPLLQLLFDASIEAASHHLGARFQFVHEHHSVLFYKVIQKILFNFDEFDNLAAKQFIELSTEPAESARYLSYGILLNEKMVEKLLARPIPLDILNYFLACNKGVPMSEALMRRAQAIKEAMECRELLTQTLNELPELLNIRISKETVSSEIAGIEVIEHAWSPERILELPDYLMNSLGLKRESVNEVKDTTNYPIDTDKDTDTGKGSSKTVLPVPSVAPHNLKSGVFKI